MSKQLIMITTPFNCGYCDTARKDLPPICEEYGFELIEMQNENNKDEDIPVNLYPTILVRINEEIKFTAKGYNKNNLLKEILKSNRDYHSGEIRISKNGLLDAHLHCGGPLYTGYYLVRKQENN